MRRRHGRWGGRVTALLAFVAGAGGCAQVLPTATVGDPAVFTTLHIVAADRAYRNDAALAGDTTGAALGVSTLGHLHRYFGTTPAEYARLGRRMDTFLEQTQRSQAYALILARKLQLEVQLKEGGLTDPTYTPSTPADAASAQPRFSAGGRVASVALSDADQAKLYAAKARVAAAEKTLAETKAGLDLQDTETARQSNLEREATLAKAAAEGEVAQLSPLITKLNAALAAEKNDANKKGIQADLDAATKNLKEQNQIVKDSTATADAAKSRGAQTKANADALRPKVDELTKQVAAATAESADAEKTATPAAPAADPTVAALARLLQPNDSPFDRLDRVNDWFMAYTTLILSGYGGDSRALDVESLKESFSQAYQGQSAVLRNEARATLSAALVALDRLKEDEANDTYILSVLARLERADQAHRLVSKDGWSEFKRVLIPPESHDVSNTVPTIATSTSPSTAPGKTLYDLLKESKQETMALTQGLGAHLQVTSNANVVEVPDGLLMRSAKLREAAADPTATPLSLMATAEQAAATMEALASNANVYDAALCKLEAKKKLDDAGQESGVREPVDESRPHDRLITLLIPISIDAGTRPNTLVGNAMKVIKVVKKYSTCEVCPTADDVRVIALNPQRSYDLEDQQLSQSFRDTTRLLAAAGFSQLGGNFDASADKQQEEASRFLSRVSKVGAWQDATTRRFGWTCAPNNLRVVPRSLVGRLGDLLASQPGREYEAQASLETGTRLCSAVLLVDKDIDVIKFSVENYAVDVDHADVAGGKLLGMRAKKVEEKVDKTPGKTNCVVPDKTLSVRLPTYDPMESLILTLPKP